MPASTPALPRPLVGVLASALVTASLAALSSTAPASAAPIGLASHTFQSGVLTSCASYSYTVPAGVTLLDITAWGAPGSPGRSGQYRGGDGGHGGKVAVTMAVSPGQTLWLSPNTSAAPGGGGYGLGQFQGGGSASLVTTVDTAPYCGVGKPTLPRDTLILVAGGGGGGASGDRGPGGNGGGAGRHGGDGDTNRARDGAGGAPGTQTSGGEGGARGTQPFATSGEVGKAGAFLRGGLGGYDGADASAVPGAEPIAQANAGSGGGGFYGGGGGGGGANGSASGGGGGGSNWVTPSIPRTTPNGVSQTGIRYDGAADHRHLGSIDVTPVFASQTSLVRSALNPAVAGQPVDFSVTVTLSGGRVPQVGTVDFFDGATVVATVPVDRTTGVATASVSTLSPGAHPIQARYNGGRGDDEITESSWAPSPVVGGQVKPYEQRITARVDPKAPVVTANPVGHPKYYSSSGAFSAAATGVPAPTVQWQESSNGGRTFTDLPGATSADLQVQSSYAKSGNQYRAVFSNYVGQAITTPATMTVLKEPMPVVPVDAAMFPGSEVPTLTASFPYFYPRFGRGLAEELTTPPTCTTTATSASPVGTYPITCHGAVLADYDPEYRVGTLTVAANSHATSFAVPHSHAGWYAGDWIHLTAQGGERGHDVVFSIDHATTPGLCQLHGSVLMLSAAPRHVDDCLVTATQPGVPASQAPPVTRAVRVQLPRQNASLIAPTTGVAGEFAVLTAHGYLHSGGETHPTSDVEVSRRAGDADVCRLSTEGGRVEVHFLGAGSCTVHAQQPEVEGRAGGTTETITVRHPTPQAITFAAGLPTASTAGLTTTLSATGGGSGSPVVFGSDTPAVCTLLGATVRLLKAGTCTVTADQAKGLGYSAAPTVRHTITVARNTGIVFFPPTHAKVGETLTLSATKVPEGRPPVEFRLDPSSGSGVCSLSGAVLTLRAVGPCVVVARQPPLAPYWGGTQPIIRTIDVRPS